MGSSSSRSRDGCLVPAPPFAELVRGHVQRWNVEKPPSVAGQFGADSQSQPLKALDWLESETGVPRGTLEGLLERGVRRKVLIELRVADAISVALGRPEMLYLLRDEVRPNPAAAAAARAGCLCGGSSRTAAAA